MIKDIGHFVGIFPIILIIKKKLLLLTEKTDSFLSLLVLDLLRSRLDFLLSRLLLLRLSLEDIFNLYNTLFIFSGILHFIPLPEN